MALTPAVCEAFGLTIIGPDAYGRIVAQDKEIAKRLALDCGILTPAWRVIRSESEASIAVRLAAPLVVKPLLEGSSIGISARSLQSTPDGAREVAVELLQKFGQPVIVEQFVAGREVSYTKIESRSEDLWGLSEVVITGDSGYFDNRLFHADEKVVRDPRRTVRNIDSELAPEDKAAIDRYLGAFGQYGYCRVDGRLCDGRFHFLELTPDAWLGRTGQFVMSYTEKGWGYDQVIAAILASVGRGPLTPPSND
jgi:D-alanine-D-alanine ligase